MTKVILFLLLGAATARMTSADSPETLAPADVRFSGTSTEVPDFQRHVVPLLGRLGCNGRNCHGSFQGRGGLRLSLFGYDFKMDYEALTGESSEGTRADIKEVDHSLILRKPLELTDHEGGQRFELESWEHRLLRGWIQAGAEAHDQRSELARLDIEPQEVVFPAENSDSEKSNSIQLRVVAVWEDGHREDVTPLCRFRTNDDSVATVDQAGRITQVSTGDSHVVAFYDNGVGAIPVICPLGSAADRLVAGGELEPSVDRFVNAKLHKLGLTPSDGCSDTEFLRRLSLDLTGTLPTPDEVESFLEDGASDKRIRKIEELLKRPAYAAWWANKLCDFTGSNPTQQAELGQETSVQWYMWTYQRLLEDIPYDELVRRIVLATGRGSDSETYEQYAAGMSAYYHSRSPADFPSRATMPHYWTRRNMQEPEEAAQAFAHNFLGIRLQCAQCHKHPFAPWTQDDFNEFSRFFEHVDFGVPEDDRATYRTLAKQVGLNLRGDNGTAIRDEVLRHAKNGKTIPWRELYVIPRETDQEISLLRSGSVAIGSDADPREPIMEWMVNEDNPWFAQAIVNRIWASYFHVGIINPPDNLSPANPPSNPALLSWLTQGFVDNDYDMKWLHRVILSSDA